MSDRLGLAPYGLVFLATMAAAAAVTPLAARIAIRLRLLDRPAPHKYHQAPTPYLGGLAVAAPVLGGLIGFIVGEPSLRREFAALGVAGGGIAMVGLLDDWRGLPVWPRLGAQGLAGLVLWVAGIRIAPTGVTPLDLALMVLLVVAITNSINLIDNMDGISTGTALIASLFFFLAAAWQGQRLVSLMAVLLAGACAGFLLFNYNPARIFLGDAGTLFLGFLLAAFAIKLDLPGYPLVTRLLVPVLILATPLSDMALVVVSRLRRGRPVFRGGTDHSSHRLVTMGASTAGAALATCAATTLTGTTALLLLVARSHAASWAVMAAVAVLGPVVLWRFERVEGVSERSSDPPARRQPLVSSERQMPNVEVDVDFLS